MKTYKERRAFVLSKYSIKELRQELYRRGSLKCKDQLESEADLRRFKRCGKL